MTALASVIIVLIVAAAGLFVVNRPKLTVVDADVPTEFAAEGFDHTIFEDLLIDYVNSAGRVDYDRWHQTTASQKRLNEYLAAVSVYSPVATPERFPRRSDELAYWLYAYNAYVIRSILNHWPLESVTDVQAPIEAIKGLGFFYQQRFLFGGTAYSLYAVENDIIRPTYKDPRIHFVLNCASGSCPVLRPELPTGDELEVLMDDATLAFVGDPRNVRVEHEQRQVVLSTIFKWYEKDFINEVRRRGLPVEHGVLDYIALVAPDRLRTELDRATGYAVTYEDYDWSLNVQLQEQAQE